MKPTKEMIEAHARADAQFDGYDFDKQTSGVQTDYLRRSRMCLTAALAAMPAPAVKVKLPDIGIELYEHYSVMSAQTHEALVKEYARGVAIDLAAENERLRAALERKP